MAEPRIVPIRTDKFRIHYEAMKAIAMKAVPPGESEMKYALLIRGYEKIYDATTDRLRENETKNAKKIGMRTMLTAAGEVRRDRIAAVVLQIKLPPKDCLIKKTDLPKSEADALEKDVENRTGTAYLASQLGPFFDYEVAGEKRELLDLTLDDGSLAALDAASTDAVELPPERPTLVLADAPEEASA